MALPRPYRLTVSRFVGPNDKRCRADAAGAQRHVFQTKTWYGTVGGRRVSLKTIDEAQARAELRRLLKEDLERAAGIRDRSIEAAGAELSQHLTDWLATVRAGGASDEYVAVLGAHLRRLAELARWRRLNDLTSDSLLLALDHLTRADGLSARTRNHYLTHAKQFGLWCVDTERLRTTPFRRVRPVSTEADRRHERREPTDAEVTLLFSCLEAAEPRTRTGRRMKLRDGMTAAARAMLYKVSMSTGFRAKEMRSLRPHSFNLERGTVTVPAAYAKNKRMDTLPLPAWLVEELGAYFASGGATWETLREDHPGDVLQRDLADAGVEYTLPGPDGKPLFLDFHSLRVYYISRLAAQPGMDMKTLLTLARHSTPTLSLQVYAKSRDQSLRAAADQLPRPGETSPLDPPPG